MHIADKLDILAAGAQYDLACACGTSGTRTRGPLGRWIYPAVLPDGRRANLLKVLLSNACTRGCAYCAQRQGRDFRRTDFLPDELASAFMEMYRQGRVAGFFLSSAIGGSSRETMERMLRTIEIVRFRHKYRGWVHLKILPGAAREQVERAAMLANRLSLNLEAPTPERLSAISPQKRFRQDILERMNWINELMEGGVGRLRGQTTQFVVGAGDESDGEFIRLMGDLYGSLRLSRIYFSAFQPVRGTPLEHRAPGSFEREHRLYQADFLLRKYGFTAGELVLDASDNLPEHTDPKSAWAGSHPELFPVELNSAPESKLLRVPGIGPVAAGRLVKMRIETPIRSLDQLRQAGAVAGRAAPWILLGGRRPHESRGAQLSLFGRGPSSSRPTAA
jgi:predicted DNA-binding helix-hairpin-helix protein